MGVEVWRFGCLVQPQILGVWWSCDRLMQGPFPAPSHIKPGKSALGTRLIHIDEYFGERLTAKNTTRVTDECRFPLQYVICVMISQCQRRKVTARFSRLWWARST